MWSGWSLAVGVSVDGYLACYDERLSFDLPYASKAKLVLHRKARYDDGAVREIVVWELPEPVLGSEHTYKYRFFYGKDGERLVGYDNERGKGDHKRIRDAEYEYIFVNIRQLLSDFYDDIQEVRGDGK